MQHYIGLKQIKVTQKMELVFTFRILFEHMKENTFYIYAGICAAGFVFACVRIKGTKGKNLEEVEQSMAID